MLVLGRPIITPITPTCGAAMRLADSVRHCVVFLGFPGSHGATGFLVGLEEEKEVYPYLVTARHVAVPHLEKTPFVIRGNLRGGVADEIDIDRAHWTCPDDPSVDVAAISFELPRNFERAVVLTRNFVDEATRKRSGNIGVGSLAYIVGLFRLHPGKTRNLPIVHTGHIALEPTEDRIPSRNRTTGELQQVDGYLVEAHTLEGLSGSPVFARRSFRLKRGDIMTGIGDSKYNFTSSPGGYRGGVGYGSTPVFNASDEEATSYWAYGPAFLLGLWSGAWDGEPGKILKEDRGLRGNIRVPVGMGIVIPADKIMETLLMPELRDARRKAREEAERGRAATMDSAFSSRSEPATKADNPSHKENFTSLLNAAARTRKPTDQT